MDIQKLISDYSNWLKNEISFEKIGDYYEITTPYLNNTNDYLQIYVKQSNDNIFFSDDGYTINKLKAGGFKFTPSRKAHLEKILLQYDINLNDDELIAKVPVNDFAQKKHMFVQAMLKIDDMFVVNKRKVASFFLDDIQDFFAQKDIFYSENVQFTGVSGYPHSYDFLLQRSKTKPERLCAAVNRPNRTSTGRVIFSWQDTKPSRKNDSELVILLNDSNSVPDGVENAFKRYGAKVIMWSKREDKQNIDYLSA